MHRSLISVLVLFCGLGLLALPASGEAQPTVTLITDDAVMAEAGQEPGQFSVHRSNDGNTAEWLNVYVERSGSAIIGTDYATTNLVHTGGTTYYVSIPPNQLSQSVTLTPVRDNIIESVEDISFILTGPLSVGHDYTIGASTQGDFTISDDVAEVTLTVDDASAAEAGQDTAGFTVTRTGNGNPAGWMNVFVERSGSAIIGTDYATTNLVHTGGTTYYVSIPPNQLSQSVILTPIFDKSVEGDETAGFKLLGPLSVGHDYTIGTPDQGEILILDFVDGIFADSFED